MPAAGANAPGRRAAWALIGLAVAIVVTAVVLLTRRGDEEPSGPAGAAAATQAPAADPSSAAPSAAVTAAVTTTTDPAPGAPQLGRTIAVDPGHNGRNATAPKEINRQVDAGGFRKACNTTGTATSSGVAESAVNWAIALEVRRGLQALGATIVLTRPDDQGVGPCIDERAAVANRARADVLLSIHADGAPSGAGGFHVIRPGLVTGYTDDIVGASSTLATAVRDALVAAGLRRSTYAGQDGLVTRTDLGTLNRSDVPACMVELGNLRNPAEAAVLTSPTGQEKAAAALVSGVAAWLARPPAERGDPAPVGPATPGTGGE